MCRFNRPYRDFHETGRPIPSVKTLGYYQFSLWEKVPVRTQHAPRRGFFLAQPLAPDSIAAALDFLPAARCNGSI